MANFIDLIKTGDTNKATSLIETVLKKKTLAFLEDSKADVAEAVYGDQLTEEVQGIPYPAKSKHLKDYKPTSNTEHEMHLEHPAGHKLVWHKDPEHGKDTFTHTSASGKVKKGKMVDLHPYLSKVHHDFEGKVKQHMRDHMHDKGYGLLHKMGALSYAHTHHPEGRDHEEDAINHKAMRSAYLKLTKSERGVK